MAMIFETHAHYDDHVFDPDRDELLSSMAEHGIGTVINVSSTAESLDDTKKLTEEWDFVYGAMGIHPDETGGIDDAVIQKTEEYCGLEKTVAVGEVGLDYHRFRDNKPQQFLWFERFLEIAREAKLPVIVHSREAAEDTYRILKERNARDIGGVMHCFSYSKEMARQILDLGFYIGVGGVSTFRNAKKLHEALEYIPLTSIVLETDSPYLAPEPHRGTRNSSLYLPLVAEAIAHIKRTDAEEVIAVTSENAFRLFPKALRDAKG